MTIAVFISNYLAKCLELGILIWGYHNGLPLYKILLLISIFHAGYISAKRVLVLNLPIPVSCLILLFGIGSLIYGMNGGGIVKLCIGIFISSTMLIQLKDNIKERYPIDVTPKFISKSVGMISSIVVAMQNSALFYTVVFALPLIFVYITFCNNRFLIKREADNAINLVTSLNWIQFFHHCHYFLFCYVFWTLLHGIQPLQFSYLFILGWIVYYFLEKHYRQKGKIFTLTQLAYGHFFSGLVILLMMIFPGNLTILLLWLMTGLGGGTIYMLRNVKTDGQFDFFEDLGHIIGCLLSACLLYISHDTTFSLIASVASAILVGVICLLRNRTIKT